MNQLTLLAKKMHSERLDVLKDNEEHIKNGGKDFETDSDEDANDIGTEQENGMQDDGFEDEENSDEEWKKQQRMFAKIGPKLHTGKPLTEDEMKEFGINEDDYDDEDDEDYEYNGGDMNLYDSLIDDVDEIEYLKNSLE